MDAIRYVKRKDIDIVKWDNCIHNADNGLIYAYSFYLDAVCENWDALVLNDYKQVMPLPWKKKWGIRYVYQPPFIQRLGVFGNHLNEALLNSFFLCAVRLFRFIHYNVTSTVLSPVVHNTVRNNFVIDLSSTYRVINNSYSNECIKNIRKAESRNCVYSTTIKLEEVVQNFRTAYGSLNHNLTDNDYTKFTALVNNCIQREMVHLAGVKDENGTTIYSAAIFKDNNRLYYVMGSPTTLGREKRATYFFIDQVLKRNAEQPLLFDFEGSDIPSVASFYKKFGPAVEQYFEVKINTLPFLIKWLK